MELNTPLKAEELDFRVQQVTSNGYAIILPYKNARVDMQRLDDVVGRDYWQRKHEVINDNLFCYIGVYNKDIKEWVWKSDVGTESFTEKEKGEASDSFKRAGFNWGIGRELYEYPVIIVKLKPEEVVEKSGKLTASAKFKPNDWNWTLISNNKGVPTLLKAVDSKGDLRFNYTAKNNTTTAVETKSQPTEQPHKTQAEKVKVSIWLTDKQFEEIKGKTKADIKKYLDYYDGKTPQKDGKVYGMKKEFKEALEKLI